MRESGGEREREKKHSEILARKKNEEEKHVINIFVFKITFTSSSKVNQ